MEVLKPEPCPCCGAEMETFRRRAATASRPEGWRVLRPKTRGCSICRYLAEGSFDVSVRLIEDWNRRAIASALHEACLAALRYDDSILGKCARGETRITDQGLGFSDAEELDALYADWMTKARAAIAIVEGRKP